MANRTNKPVFLYVATYSSVDDAKVDYAGVKQLYFDGVIGAFDAAVVSKDATGQVKIHKTRDADAVRGMGWPGRGSIIGYLLPTLPDLGTRGRRSPGNSHRAPLGGNVAFRSERDWRHSSGEHGNPDRDRPVEAARGLAKSNYAGREAV